MLAAPNSSWARAHIPRGRAGHASSCRPRHARYARGSTRAVRDTARNRTAPRTGPCPSNTNPRTVWFSFFRVAWSGANPSACSSTLSAAPSSSESSAPAPAWSPGGLVQLRAALRQRWSRSRTRQLVRPVLGAVRAVPEHTCQLLRVPARQLGGLRAILLGRLARRQSGCQFDRLRRVTRHPPHAFAQAGGSSAIVFCPHRYPMRLGVQLHPRNRPRRREPQKMPIKFRVLHTLRLPDRPPESRKSQKL